MARYLSLINFTDQGLSDISGSPARTKVFEAAVKKAGGRVDAVYWSLGDIDGAVIFEAPDAETATALLLHLGREGFVRTRTLRVFDSEEFERIVQRL